MPKFYKLMFFNTMIMGSFITLSSHSWMVMWMGLELNIMSFIPLIYNKKSIYSSEATMKYFIIQTLASTLLIFSLSLLEFNFNSTFSFFKDPSFMLSYSAIMMKLGMAPFHSWFPEVIEGLNWNMSLILLTWQKLAPMSILMMMMTNYSSLLMILIIFSSLIGSMMGMNQISLRKILAFSSINHMAWMLLSMMSSIYLWMFYFLIYSISNFNLIFLFNKNKIFYILQLNSSSLSYFSKSLILLNFLSLAGLPPMIGFLPKWLVISFSVYNCNYLTPVIIIISTLMAIFFYLQVIFPTFFIKNPSKTNFSEQNNSTSFILMNIVFLFSLLISNLIF